MYSAILCLYYEIEFILNDGKNKYIAGSYMLPGNI